MAGSDIIEISDEQLKDLRIKKIEENEAHTIIETTKKRVLMIFQREDESYYGYYASQITDLNHAKKVQLVDFVGFFNHEL